MSTSQSRCSGVLSTPRFVARTGIAAMIGVARQRSRSAREQAQPLPTTVAQLWQRRIATSLSPSLPLR